MSEVEPAPLWGGTSYPFSISFHPGLARALEHAGYGSATTKAIILSRIHDLLPTSPFIRDGVPWVGNSHTHWRADHFPFLSVAGVKTLFKKLEQDGLLIAKTRGRTNPVAYRPNYPKLAELQANEPEKLVANEQIKVTFGGQKPPTSAPAEQSAPQTTPTPAEPTQDVTAAHVEQGDTQEAGGATLPTRTPHVELEALASIPATAKNLMFSHEQDGFLYWKQSGEVVARCSAQRYLHVAGLRHGGLPRSSPPHPNNIPMVSAALEGRSFRLRPGALGDSNRRLLEEIFAARFGFLINSHGKWERR